MHATARRRGGWWLAALLLGAGAPGCFQSDFLLYGPPCDVAADCDDALGDGDAHRACFRPEPSATRGYCTELCAVADGCAASEVGDVRCLRRARDDGDATHVCALVCEGDADCPKGMRCAPDPQGEAEALCGFE